MLGIVSYFSLVAAERAQRDALLQSKVAQFKAEQEVQEKLSAQAALAAAREANEKLNAAQSGAQKTQSSSADYLAEALSHNPPMVAFSQILQAMRKTNDPYQVAVLGQSIAALGMELSSEQADQTVDFLLKAIDGTSDQSAISALGQALSAIIMASAASALEGTLVRLHGALLSANDPDKAIVLSTAIRLPLVTSEVSTSYTISVAAKLTEFANLFTPNQADEASDILFQAYLRTRDRAGEALASALLTIVPKLSPPDAKDLLDRITSQAGLINSSSPIVSGKGPIEAVLQALRKRVLITTRNLICIGDGTSRTKQCPPEAQMLPCGSSIDDWARANQCTITEQRKLADTEGGKCGYAIFQVQCSRPASK